MSEFLVEYFTGLSNLWPNLISSYASVSILLPLGTSYRCELAFSAVPPPENKY